MSKTYKVGQSDKGRPTLVLTDKDLLTFSVWRDLARLCGCSWDEGQKAIFECLLPKRLLKAEKLLVEYGWVKEDSVHDTDRDSSEGSGGD